MEKQKKKVNSIVWQVVFFPLGVVMLILIIAVFLCFFSIQVLSNRRLKAM